MSSEPEHLVLGRPLFKPQQEEEYRARVSRRNSCRYSHKIEEARAAKSLSREEALAAAQQLLQAKLGTNLDNWSFLPERSEFAVRPKPAGLVVHTGNAKNFKAKDAPYRLEVGWQGDHIGNTQEISQVPEHGRARTNICAPVTFSITRSR